MIRHLKQADYRVQRWANGRGETVEIARADGPDGLLWRLSVAQVVEDGPFSRFPGIRRNLTVIDGPGFVLQGRNLHLRADPLVPVAFSGDAEVWATGVTAPSRDFNVMADAYLSPPDVWLAEGPIAAGGLCAIHALTRLTVDGCRLDAGETLLTDGPTTSLTGPALAVRIRLTG